MKFKPIGYCGRINQRNEIPDPGMRAQFEAFRFDFGQAGANPFANLTREQRLARLDAPLDDVREGVPDSRGLLDAGALNVDAGPVAPTDLRRLTSSALRDR